MDHDANGPLAPTPRRLDPVLYANDGRPMGSQYNDITPQSAIWSWDFGRVVDDENIADRRRERKMIDQWMPLI